MPTPGERLDRNSAGMPYKPDGRAFKPYDIEIVPLWNGRDMKSSETRQHIEELKTSIRARISSDPPLPALIYPVEIKYTQSTGNARLIAGECRLTACRELWDEGIEVYVPTVDVPKDATDVQLILTKITENSGQPLTQWENGSDYRKLHVGHGLSIEAIAAHACKSKRYVTEAIELARTITKSTAVKEMLNEGEVTPSAVLHAIKERDGDADAAAETLREAVAAQPRPAEPPQTSIAGTAKAAKPRPVTRPKAPSAKEKEVQNGSKLLTLADAMYRLILDLNVDMSELELAAKAYGKARGL